MRKVGTKGEMTHKNEMVGNNELVTQFKLDDANLLTMPLILEMHLI